MNPLRIPDRKGQHINNFTCQCQRRGGTEKDCDRYSFASSADSENMWKQSLIGFRWNIHTNKRLCSLYVESINPWIPNLCPW